jgi:hypothetical protein
MPAISSFDRIPLHKRQLQRHKKMTHLPGNLIAKKFKKNNKNFQILTHTLITVWEAAYGTPVVLPVYKSKEKNTVGI